MLSPIILPQGAISRASILGLILCITTALLNRFLRGGKAKKYPAGPKPWPIIGNMSVFRGIVYDTEATLAWLAKDFGDKVMIWLFSKPFLIVDKLEDAKELMDKRGSIFSDRPKPSNFVERVWPCLLPIKPLGDEYRIVRRIYNDLLGPKQSQSVRKYQDYESRMLMRDLYHAPEKFQVITERYSMSVIFSAVYGVRIGRLDYPVIDELFSIMDTMANYILPGSLLIDYLPFLQRLPECFQPWLKFADNMHARESKFHNGFLNVLKEQIEAGTASYCFGVDVLKLQEKNGLSDEFTLDILKGVIAAGSETTSSMLQSIFKALAMNPEAQRKAQEELDRVVGPSRLPHWDDAPNLPYIRALIKELHRWTPLFILGVPHASTEEVIYRGYTLPQKTLVMPHVYRLSRDPDVYQDPDAFAPERFLGDDLDSYASAKQSDFRKRDHVNYGWGRRLCQGIQVAENSIFMQVSRLLWAYNVAPLPDEPLRLEDRLHGIVKKPKPFRLSITPRSEEAAQVVLQAAKQAVTSLPDADSVVYE
ncbi:Cytochrome P450 monooxygenase yanC [Trichoderma ghanense]|uniref:Cytochrome P450 monooxygenase yanC n=1 Tax=Trichoderma ghanense TaxID=65468 RepID=A0ABY2HB90_9HYPO